MMIESTSGFTNEALVGVVVVWAKTVGFFFFLIYKNRLLFPAFYPTLFGVFSIFLSHSFHFSCLVQCFFVVFLCVCFFFSRHCWNGRSQLERELVCCQQRTWKSWRMRKPRHLGRPTRRTKLRRWPKSGCQSRKMRRRRKPAGHRPTAERRQCWHSGQ